MNLEQLKEKISEVCTILIVKEGAVFTMLLSGIGLSTSGRFQQIFSLIKDYAMNKYPIVEAMRNDDEYFCIVLLPEEKKEADSGWIPIDPDPGRLNKILKNSPTTDCLIKFDNGKIIRFRENWPDAVATHCKPF